MNYWIHPSIKWKRFKELNTPFQGDLVPQHMDRVLWEMLRERRINIILSSAKKDKKDPMVITLKNIPKKAKLLI